MSESINGLAVSIYKTSELGDCTNGGNSSRINRAVITGAGVDCTVHRTHDPIEHFVIVKDRCVGRERLRAIPADLIDSGKWTMFGGNFLYTSDSRFPSNSPIAIHDRVE